MEKNNLVLDGSKAKEKYFPFWAKEMQRIVQDKYNISVPKECGEFLIRCLRSKDGSLGRASKMLKSFYAATGELSSWDAKLMPSLYSEFQDSGALIPLKKRDHLGRHVLIIRTEAWAPSRMKFDEAIVALWMMAQFASAESKDAQRHGFVSIWDFRNFSLEQAWALKQWRIISVAKWICNGVVGRIKEMHIINHPRIFGMIYSGVEPFLNGKLKKRIIFHKNYDSLLKHVDAELLPTYMHGTLDPKECVDKQMLKDLLNADRFFQDMLRLRLPTK